MPEVNRYTQMPQPLILNPLSFEELSRVPLAKAQASAEGAAALNRIQTDYNVDERDLGQVTQWVDEIDQQKTNIVDTMFNHGVTNQVVNDVLKLKRDRDNLYKNRINQAEENKRRIEAWRQSVDQMYAKDSPEYAEFVKQKEMSNWQGTFAYGDTPQTFVGSTGPKYFDLKKDVFEYMSQGKEMTELESKYRSAGAPREVSIGDYSAIYTPGEYSKQVLSNKFKLAAVADQLRKEYKDANTERGRFKQYVEMTDQELDYEINQAYNAYLQEMTREQGGGGSYSGMQQKEKPPQNLIPYFGQEAQEYAYKKLDEINKMSTGTVSNIVNAYREMRNEFKPDPNKPIGVSIGESLKYFYKKLVDKSIGSEKERVKLVRDNFKELAWDLQQRGVITEKERLIAQGYKDRSSGLTDKDIERIQTNVIKKIQNHLDEHSTENQQSYIISADQMRTNYGLPTKLDPVKAAEDFSKGDFPIFTREERKLITPKNDLQEFEDIKKAILTGQAQIEGVATMFSPDLTDNKGNYIPGMASANLVTIKDKDSEFFGKQYYIKQPDYVRNTDQFRRMDETNFIVSNTPMGGSSQLFITNEKGYPEIVTIKQTGITGGDFRLYFTERGDKDGVKLNSEEGKYYSAMLYGPEYLRSHLK